MVALLHLHDEYHIADFAGRRHRACVALLVMYPKVVGYENPARLTSRPSLR